jgi:hypothetical protein
MAKQEIEMGAIEERLRSIEMRLMRIETAMEISEQDKSFIAQDKIWNENAASTAVDSDDEEKGLESLFGRYGLASLGNIVLFFGITFLAQYLMNSGQSLLSAILGYLSASGIFFLAKYLKKSNVPLAFMFKITGQILLFYITLRLHFFSEVPLISMKYVSVALLFIVIGYQVYWAVRNQSQTLSVISVIFALTAAVVTDSTHITLPIVTIGGAVSVYYFYRFRWQPLVILTILMTYSVFFMWLFGNPVMGHPLVMISDHNYGIIYLFLLGAIYSSLMLFRRVDSGSDGFYAGVTFTNGIFFTFLLALSVLRFFSNDYVTLFMVITISCLLYSALLHSKSDWNFASAFYALYGFMAMSISLYGIYGFPKVYLLLSVQSLVVVSMALWFRNRLIVVMNSLLFLFIMLVYLLSSKSNDSVNFSFALIAIISARVINWQSSRLKIETHIMRNLYLIEGFVMVLLALYHAVPKHLITLSWIMAALVYFVLSIILKNVKYRYMALGTMIFAALYLFMVDLASIEIVYRIMALLFLAAISIGISMYYTSRIKIKDKDQAG